MSDLATLAPCHSGACRKAAFPLRGDTQARLVRPPAHVSTLPRLTYSIGQRPSLRIALTENRGKKFLVTMPYDVSPGDRNALLDLRSQGFYVAIHVA